MGSENHQISRNIGLKMCIRWVDTTPGEKSLISDNRAGEIGKDRSPGGETLAVCHLPDGRGRGAAPAVRGDPGADTSAEGGYT